MRRAGSATLARISPLLEDLRSRTVLREVRPGVFTLQSRAFIHFHDDDDGIFADVRLAEAFVRMPVTSRSEQADLLEAAQGKVREAEEAADRQAEALAQAKGKAREARLRHDCNHERQMNTCTLTWFLCFGMRR